MWLQEARVEPEESWGMFTWTFLKSFLGLKKLLRSYLEPKKLLKKVHVNVPQNPHIDTWDPKIGSCDPHAGTWTLKWAL